MLRRLLRWLGLGSRHSVDVYSPRERLIYHYFDGTKMIRADPLVLWRRVSDVGPELSNDIQVAESISKNAKKAQQEVIQKLCKIFGVKELDQEGGLTETDITRLFYHFMNYMDVLKKKVKPTSMSAPATSVSSESTPAVEPPIQNMSGSGSTVPVSDSVPPQQSPSELESHLVILPPETSTSSPSVTEPDKPSISKDSTAPEGGN